MNKTVSNKRQNIDNLLLSSILSLLNKNSLNSWQGTMTDLNSALVKMLKIKKTQLPGSPSSLRVALNRVVNRLRRKSVSIQFRRSSDRSRTRLVRFSM